MYMNSFISKYRDIYYYWTLSNQLRGCTTVLDVGCGNNSPLVYVKKKFKSVGIDIYKPAINESKKNKIHDSYVNGDISRLDKYFKPKSFDAVMALDVVEHLSKDKSMKMISQMEKIAIKKVIILTPNGFYHQDTFEGNPYQVHKSGWIVNDFLKMGYTVRGLRGLKYLRMELARIRYKPWIFWAPISYITEPLFSLFPRLSYHLFAMKNLIIRRV